MAERRASGRTAAEEEAAEAAEQADLPVAIDLPGDDSRDRHHTPGFSRMRTEWGGPDAGVLARVQGSVEERILSNFALAYEIMGAVFSIVRTAEVGPNGIPLVDQHGQTRWKRSAVGVGYEEDFSRLTTAQREHFLFQITTHLFNWEQAAAEAWTEAMFAKAIWEESFAVGFESIVGGRPTVDDRRAAGVRSSMDDRFFAIFVSAYSRRADAIVRSLERLAQRLKDVITT